MYLLDMTGPEFKSASPQPEPICVAATTEHHSPSTNQPSTVVYFLSDNMAIFQYTAKGVDWNNLIFLSSSHTRVRKWDPR